MIVTIGKFDKKIKKIKIQSKEDKICFKSAFFYQ